MKGRVEGHAVVPENRTPEGRFPPSVSGNLGARGQKGRTGVELALGLGVGLRSWIPSVARGRSWCRCEASR